MSSLFEALYRDIKEGKSIREICRLYGGLQIYIPSEKKFLKEKLKQEFNGGNYQELARKYRLSVRQVYRLLGGR